MTYADFFSEIKGQFMEADVSGITEHLAYQFNIVGDPVLAVTLQKLKVEGDIGKALRLKEFID